MITNLNKNLIPIAIIVAGVLVAGAFIYINQTNPGNLTLQEASEKAINFINQNVEENVTASLVEAFEEGNVYRIHLKIADTDYESYITKDGKFLFPSGINLEEYKTETETQTQATSSASSLDSFAQCLTDKGVKFYGAFWCGVCNSQKELFGEAVQYLPYIECSDQETRETLPVCQEAGITSFPTWEFNGQKSSGFKSLEQLAEMSGCVIE